MGKMQKELESILLDISKTEEIDSGDLRIASEKIILQCAAGLKIARASMWKVLKHKIECEVLVDEGRLISKPGLFLLRKDFPDYFNELDKERVIVAVDAETYPATASFAESYLRPLNIKSMLDVPIRHKGKMIGIICCEYQGDGIKQWTDDETVFVSTLAELSGRALNAYFRKQYEQELEQINRKLQHMVDERTSELKETVEHLQAAQVQLVENEKMAALGRLVAGVAHEVNTPLGVAITSISLCKEYNSEILKDIDDNNLVEADLVSKLKVKEEALALADKNLNRAAQLVHDFKQTSVDQTNLCLEEIDLKQYLTHILNTLSPLLKTHNIALHEQLESGVIMTTYPGLLAQILTNLTTNAIVHGFAKCNVEKRCITIGLTSLENSVKLTVSDNGCGIKAEHVKHIFEPFFTTNRGQGGSGLGLSIVYNIVCQKLAGKISVHSVESEGCTFTIELPLNVTS